MVERAHRHRNKLTQDRGFSFAGHKDSEIERPAISGLLQMIRVVIC